MRRRVLVLAVGLSACLTHAHAQDPGQNASPVEPLSPIQAAETPPADLARANQPSTTTPQQPNSLPRNLAGLSRGNNWVMLGDRGPFSIGPERSIKVSENQSPRPQDRVYYSFNYFDGLNQDAGERLRRPVRNIEFYRNLFGAEKTFSDGRGSVGLRLPLNTLSADPAFQQPVGRSITDTAVGNLDIIGKYILLENEEAGGLISGGLVVTPPTGPGQFASAAYLVDYNSTVFQPFVGYIWNPGNFYLQGFSGLDVPTDQRDVTLMYNDIGIGYFLRYDGPGDPERFVTLIAPTFEVHVNTPLNHRDPFDPRDPAGTPDVVNLTYGLNVGIRQRGLFTIGVVTPVTGPQPFSFEVMALFNYYFGAPRQNMIPPVLGGF